MNLLKKSLTLAATAVITVSAHAGTYSGGSGTVGDPYLISTPENMNAIGTDANDWDKHFLLTTDLDLSGYTGEAFNLIGNTYQGGGEIHFTGVFDGDGHTISNFTYLSPTADWDVAIFRRTENAEIKNLGLIDPNVVAESASLVGALVSDIRERVNVSNCYVQGGSVRGKSTVGGLAGRIIRTDSVVTDCYVADCNVSTVEGGCAGLVGKSYGTITNCHTSGTVTAGDNAAGGLVSSSWGTISNCYSTATITGESYLGGLVATNNVSATYGPGSISNSYATGDVNGVGITVHETGGFAEKNCGTISNCFSTGEVSGGSYSVAVGGIVGQNYVGPFGPATADGKIDNCYSTGNVINTGQNDIGGFVGQNKGAEISKCYSLGTAEESSYSWNIGGFVGGNSNGGTITDSFWDEDASGRTTSAGGTGLDTNDMQDM